jgi:UPF0042 nucleotide-binding protein
MRVVLVTGMSGSGKTQAIHALEDIGFYTIDNLPIQLIDKLVQLFSGTQGEVEKLALVIDARAVHRSGGTMDLKLGGATSDLDSLPSALESIRLAGHEVDLLFLDASDEVLERRYSETRRRHPLATDGTLKSGIQAEREVLEPLRFAANRIIDTGRMSVHELRKEIERIYTGAGTAKILSVTVMSFGFKHGVPPEADMVLDVRFLPNPHFVQELRPLTGENEAVARFVLDRDETRAFLEHTYRLLEFLLPKYDEEGKAYLTLAIGCTGGRHRSVSLVREIADWMSKQGRRVQVRHRDISR